MERIDEIWQSNPTIENRQIEVELHVKLQEYLKRKYLIWQQKYRELWLKDDDC